MFKERNNPIQPEPIHKPNPEKPVPNSSNENRK